MHDARVKKASCADFSALVRGGEPVVFRAAAARLAHLSKAAFFDEFGAIESEFRVHVRGDSTVAEGAAEECRASFGSFAEWADGVTSGRFPTTAAAASSRDESWAYCAYRRVADLEATGLAALLEGLDGDLFQGALAERGVGPSDATLWLGTAGAHTPAHYDSRQCNVVAQGFGAKRWRLWPPNTASLEPARLPYEESTVWASRDVRRSPPPCAHEVTLGAGDVLFLPRHWWHAVECVGAEGASLALNVWVPLATDTRDQALEALGRFTATALIPTYADSDWVNPGEVLWPADETAAAAAAAVDDFRHDTNRYYHGSPLRSSPTPLTRRRLIDALLAPATLQAALAHLLAHTDEDHDRPSPRMNKVRRLS